MPGVVLGPNGEPVRAPGLTGEWVDLSALVSRRELESSADPLQAAVDALVRRYDPGGSRSRWRVTT